MKKIKIGIIGYGKLGSVLAEVISKRHKLIWIVERNKTRVKLINQKVKIYSSIQDIIEIPELIIISVNDSEIESASGILARTLNDKLKKVWVVHCSGVLPVSVLSACEKKGAETACIHPYQTFFEPDLSVLKGIGWTIETKKKPDFLKSFIKQIEGKSFLISDKNKVLHHLSAVFASNFLTTVLSNAGEIEKIAGLNTNDFLPPIVETTVRNNYKSMTSKNLPLTGPIARADINTIKTHLKALKKHKTLYNTYIYLSLATLETAKSRKKITKQKFAEIREILLSSLNG